MRPSWGLLTGIRPVKLVTQCREKGMGEEEIFQYFTQNYLVSPRKALLALETERNEREILARSLPESFSLYISIPFCPTRCSYCSFVSQDMRGCYQTGAGLPKQAMPGIGGHRGKSTALGTPSPNSLFRRRYSDHRLSAKQLELLLKCVEKQFDLSSCQEYTVEAGRPDTITREKLRVMKQAGVRPYQH